MNELNNEPVLDGSWKESPFCTTFTRSGKDVHRTVQYELKRMSSISNTQL
jgi:hypothetical protein